VALSAHRPSVGSLVVAVLVSVVTLLMAAVGMANYGSYRDDAHRALGRELAIQADQLAVALALPVWNIDRVQIDRILDSLEADHAIVAVRVDAAARVHGRWRDQGGRLVGSDGRFATEGLLGAHRAITVSGDELGSLDLYVTPRLVEKDLAAIRRTIVESIVAVDVLLVLSLYVLLRRSVLEPIRDIERYAVAVRAGATDAIPAAPASARELESLRSSIEAMVTLLERRYQEARDSEKRYRDIVHFSPIGIYQDRPDGTFIMMNRAGARLLGFASPEEGLGTNAHDFLADPEERARLTARYIDIGYGERTDVRFKRRDGTLFWAELSSHAVKDEAGQPLYFESFLQDVEGRHVAEVALRTSEERYRLLFEGNPVPMLVYDLATLEFLAANQAAVEQYSYSRAELLGLHVPDLALPDDPALAIFLATRFDPRAQVVHVGLRRQRRKDGSILDVDMTSLTVTFDGRASRLLLCRDVTAEALAQAQQERLQESLRRSQTMAAMGALVAGVAHEVRNPLFSLTATVDALEAELRDRPEFVELAGLLRSQVARLTQLMRDLLDYGKPSGLSLVTVSAGEPLRLAVRACATLAASKGVELATQVAPALPAVRVDVARLQQVFENLIANAVQHAPPGTRVRLAALSTQGEDGPAATFQVEDEGPGILESDLPRLFEPFFSRRKGGTGLGLPIVQRIVEAHGGLVTAANGARGGALFTVTVPAAPPGEERAAGYDVPTP